MSRSRMDVRGNVAALPEHRDQVIVCQIKITLEHLSPPIWRGVHSRVRHDARNPLRAEEFANNLTKPDGPGLFTRAANAELMSGSG